MSKWTFRLIGLIIVLLIGAILFRNWFFPSIPPVLQQEISLQVNGKEQTLRPSAPDIQTDQKDEEKPLTLTSLNENVTPASTVNTPQVSNRENQAPQSTEKVSLPQSAAVTASENTNSNETTKKPTSESIPPTLTPAAPPKSQEEDAVVATAPKPAETIEVTPERTNKRRRGNWVQAGAFSNKENADNFVAKLKRRGWPVVTEDATVNGKLMHRVLVGPLSRSDVDVYIDILGKMGFNARQVSR